MAGGPSVYQANRMLNKSLKDTAYTAPGTFYIALFTTAVETNLRSNTPGSASEVANANAYARQSVSPASISTSSAGQSQITVDVLFPTATGAWGTVYQAALMDSATWGAGNVIYFGPLSSASNIQTGDILKIPSLTFNINL